MDKWVKEVREEFDLVGNKSVIMRKFGAAIHSFKYLLSGNL